MWKRENIGQSNAYLVTNLIGFNYVLLVDIDCHSPSSLVTHSEDCL